MLGRDSSDEIWSRFVIRPKPITSVSRTQPTGPLCLWQCFLHDFKSCQRHLFLGDPPLPEESPNAKPNAADDDGHHLWVLLSIHLFRKPVQTWKTVWPMFLSQSPGICIELQILVWNPHQEEETQDHRGRHPSLAWIRSRIFSRLPSKSTLEHPVELYSESQFCPTLQRLSCRMTCHMNILITFTIINNNITSRIQLLESPCPLVRSSVRHKISAAS